MKTILYTLAIVCAGFSLQAQSTALHVYDLLQQKCVGCHGNASPEAGLDLEGAGATVQAKALDVYSNLLNVTPANASAAASGYKYIYPGRPDRSFLFRKVNQGLDPALTLPSGHGDPMPGDGSELADEEKELIRQWIVFGAPAAGIVADPQLLADYYSGQGLASFPAAPPAPDPGEGFQIKMGPFFLRPAGEPGDELEYFQKYELDLPANVEVNRLEILMSGSSHHFILYNFTSQAAAGNIPHGLRLDALHQDIGLFAAVQEATDLKLPQGTAFSWEKNLVLDLNSHYINYSAGLVYQAEAYVNVYTQSPGVAAQEMQASLVANTNIYIPNNGDVTTKTQVINTNIGEVYLWGIMGHTHKYGTDYKAYERINGAQGPLLYDGSCAQGIPGCASPFFDYQHIPMRYFEPLRPLTMNFANGLIHEASWINDGPEPVWFGPTSDDEMMVLILMYTLDSTGVIIAGSAERPAGMAFTPEVQPNPVSTQARITLPSGWKNGAFRLYDAAGTLRLEIPGISGSDFLFHRGSLPEGLYFFQLEEDSGQRATGKLVLLAD